MLSNGLSNGGAVNLTTASHHQQPTDEQGSQPGSRWAVPRANHKEGASKGYTLQQCGEHKGHNQLLVRGLVAFAQAALSLSLLAALGDIPHNQLLMCCQLVASASLVIQWHTASPWMFVLRAAPSFVRVVLLLHLSACGRRHFWQDCDTHGWEDVRCPFRVIHIFAAIRFFLNGSSLLLQFRYPLRGVTTNRGNEQLLYRSCVRIAGVPLQLLRGILKLALLTETDFERSSIEITVNFLRCILITTSAASLFIQWRTTGTGIATVSPEEGVAASKELAVSEQTPVVQCATSSA